jgi:hypothetical protein
MGSLGLVAEDQLRQAEIKVKVHMSRARVVKLPVASPCFLCTDLNSLWGQAALRIWSSIDGSR